MKKHSCCNSCKALTSNMRCSLGYKNIKIPKGISPLQFQFYGNTFYGYPQEPCPKPMTDIELKKFEGEKK